MSDVKIYRNSTEKPFDIFLEDLSKGFEAAGFSIQHRDKSDLIAFYQGEGIDLPDNYRHIMLQICKPQNSGKSLPANPERSVFVQKFVFVYNKGGKTEIRFLNYSENLIGELLGHNEFERGPSDDMFAEGMQKTFANMESIIQEAV